MLLYQANWGDIMENELKRFDLKTRCRAIFTISYGLISLEGQVLDDTFFQNLHDFASFKIDEDKNKYMPIFLLLLPYKKEGLKYQFYEDDNSRRKLFEILGSIKDINQYRALLDSVGQKTVDKISELASEYVDYVYSFDDKYVPSLLPQ